METRPKTIFCDIDGCICVYDHDVIEGVRPMTLTPGTLEKMKRWRDEGHRIILTTGRDADKMQVTVSELRRLGVPFHDLMMGLGGGVRYLINDKKPDGTISAVSFCLERNSGLGGVEL